MPRLAARLAGFALWAGLSLTVAAPTAFAQQLEARLSSSRVSVGEPFTLTVSVRGGRLKGEPEFETPDGIELQAQNRAQSFSWVNGRATNELQFVYQLAAENPGHYDLGPVQVRIGDRILRSGVMSLEAVVAPASASVGEGSDEASLFVDLIPREPWVGQATTLRTRLVQRSTFAEDPQYLPPSATGFWSEPPSAPESYYGTSGRERVLVTETRARLYPLAAGRATIGEAVAQVVLGGGSDPYGLMGGGRRRVVLRSAPVTVRVRALPGGAPASFGGAVGEFVAGWGIDRTRTTLDVPILITLDVRGVGNLPLVRAPELVLDGFDVFAGTSEDSAAAPGGPGLGRRRFRWTVLGRQPGGHTFALPGFAWFDPARGAYRSLAATRLEIRVDPAPPAGPEGGTAGVGVRTAGAADAGARPARPWVFAIAGLLAGLAVVLLGRSRAPVPDAPERARALEWLRAVGTAKGPDFWSAAERGGAWLAARGAPVPGLEARIAAARYGGVGLDDDEQVRRQMIERLSRALPTPPPRAALAFAGVLVFACAVLAIVFLGWAPAPATPQGLLRLAESSARRGDLASAVGAWEQAWNTGLRTPAIAARLAAAALERGDVAQAGVWVLRGHRVEGRDHALGEAEARVRESGGLVGASPRGLPVRRIEWGIAALVLGIAAGAFAKRRVLARVLAALALLAGGMPALEALARSGTREAVVREARLLGDEGLELQPGQVVRVLGSAGESDVAIGIARETKARVPRSALIEVDPAPVGGRP